MTSLESSITTFLGFVIAYFAGMLGYNIGRDKERERAKPTHSDFRLYSQTQPQPLPYVDVELEELRKMVGLTDRRP